MTAIRSLQALLLEAPFQAYAYSYPHKTSYRPLVPAPRLEEVWQAEATDALFLYLHVPFCEQRCGFCNLFTQSQPAATQVVDYLQALERQAKAIQQEIRPQGFARMAIGGGTPTFLTSEQLRRVFAIAEHLGAAAIPCSVEASPSTVDSERVAVLRDRGVSRVSMGVQSTIRAETNALRRHQHVDQVQGALGMLRDAGIPTVNADLMYGQSGQDIDSFCAAIDQVIAWGANELYLYPLYIRPLTTLGRLGQSPSERQLDLYCAGRDHLRRLGWQQETLRLFRSSRSHTDADLRYRCQDDGMIGLGPGARSYTQRLHYASGYAIGQAAVRSHLAEWSAQTTDDFTFARHGIMLDMEDQQRRFVILSLLESGLDETAYAERFGAPVTTHFPELQEVIDLGLATQEDGWWRLTENGIQRADTISRWLYSGRVERLMEDWQPA